MLTEVNRGTRRSTSNDVDAVALHDNLRVLHAAIGTVYVEGITTENRGSVRSASLARNECWLRDGSCALTRFAKS